MRAPSCVLGRVAGLVLDPSGGIFRDVSHKVNRLRRSMFVTKSPQCVQFTAKSLLNYAQYKSSYLAGHIILWITMIFDISPVDNSVEIIC